MVPVWFCFIHDDLRKSKDIPHVIPLWRGPRCGVWSYVLLEPLRSIRCPVSLVHLSPSPGPPKPIKAHPSLLWLRDVESDPLVMFESDPMVESNPVLMVESDPYGWKRSSLTGWKWAPYDFFSILYCLLSSIMEYNSFVHIRWYWIDFHCQFCLPEAARTPKKTCNMIQMIEAWLRKSMFVVLLSYICVCVILPLSF